MKFTAILSSVVVLTVVSGAIRGHLDHRWGPTDEMLVAGERVAAMPMQLGAWHAQTVGELSADTVSMLRCTGNTFRVYSHQPTGKQVSVVFMVGPAGPLAIHTPDVCYRSSNYREHAPRSRHIVVDASGKGHEFFVTTFQENNVGQQLLRVYYAWNHDQSWQAPASPRAAFAGVPMLYKLQVATQVADDIDDAGEQFLQDALPFLVDVLRTNEP